MIVERRQFDRRGRRLPGEGPRDIDLQKRVIRDRRRARVAGDMLPLASGS